jgi:hypothetical protein
VDVRQPGWRLLAVVAVTAVLWAAAGYWLSSDDSVEAWLYRIGLTGAALAPLLFVGIYTWIGLSGRAPAAWWRDEVGTALVIAALTLVPLAAPLAYVFWFMGGALTQSWLAWLAVSGPCVSALAWLRLCWLWLRISGRKGAG